jgi:hypothetical protein
MRVRYFIKAIKIRRLKIVMVAAGLNFQRTIFKVCSWLYFMIGSAHLKRNLLPEGPFEANTSHPILMIGNTAGVYTFES